MEITFVLLLTYAGGIGLAWLIWGRSAPDTIAPPAQDPNTDDVT